MLGALGLLASAAGATPDDTGAVGGSEAGAEQAPSRSVGYPWRGRLSGARKLRESKYITHAKGDEGDEHFYGTAELVRLIRRAVTEVHKAVPTKKLVVGELSAEHGGDVPGHGSHENGRDADLGFFLRDESGQPVQAEDFVPIHRSGRGTVDDQRVYFDARRNWLLMRALIEDERVHLQHVFVSPWIRRTLLDEARRQGASHNMLEKAKFIILPPDVRHPHHNHYHMRIYCPANDLPGCHDRGPYWPWLPDSHPFAERADDPRQNLKMLDWKPPEKDDDS